MGNFDSNIADFGAPECWTHRKSFLTLATTNIWTRSYRITPPNISSIFLEKIARTIRHLMRTSAMRIRTQPVCRHCWNIYRFSVVSVVRWKFIASATANCIRAKISCTWRHTHRTYWSTLIRMMCTWLVLWSIAVKMAQLRWWRRVSWAFGQRGYRLVSILFGDISIRVYRWISLAILCGILRIHAIGRRRWPMYHSDWRGHRGKGVQCSTEWLARCPNLAAWCLVDPDGTRFTIRWPWTMSQAVPNRICSKETLTLTITMMIIGMGPGEREFDNWPVWLAYFIVAY